MTFVKGQSGNPHGRPAIDREFRHRCQNFMQKSGWAALENMANNPASPHCFKSLELIGAYAYGKPTQPVSGDDDAPPISVTVSFDRANPDPESDQG